MFGAALESFRVPFMAADGRVRSAARLPELCKFASMRHAWCERSGMPAIRAGHSPASNEPSAALLTGGRFAGCPSEPSPMTLRSRRLALAAATAVISACGGGDSDGGTLPSTPTTPTTPVRPATSSATVEAAGEANVFTPAAVRILREGVVTWTFPGPRPHNVVFRGTATGTPANVPTVSSGQAARTFPTVGEFLYTCTIHPGMDGRVSVVAQ